MSNSRPAQGPCASTDPSTAAAHHHALVDTHSQCCHRNSEYFRAHGAVVLSRPWRSIHRWSSLPLIHVNFGGPFLKPKRLLFQRCSKCISFNSSMYGMYWCVYSSLYIYIYIWTYNITVAVAYMVKISFRFGNLYLILLPYLKYLNIENAKSCLELKS